ncbi:MAG TPA: hypothetical protein PLS11_08435, partial [Ottowia sp.]|nr:hypothetical protein [Ottowia sp.]
VADTKHDFAALNDGRWRAMTHDQGAASGDAFGHFSCARHSAVIGHRARPAWPCHHAPST